MTRQQYADWSGRIFSGIKGVVVHHYGNDYNGIWQTAYYHVYTKLWPTIGYHVVIQMDGTINFCIPFDFAPYHVSNRNHEFIGVALTGNLEDSSPTEKQIAAFNWLYDYQKWSYPVYGHKEVGSSSCPGNRFVDWSIHLRGRSDILRG